MYFGFAVFARVTSAPDCAGVGIKELSVQMSTLKLLDVIKNSLALADLCAAHNQPQRCLWPFDAHSSRAELIEEKPRRSIASRTKPESSLRRAQYSLAGKLITDVPASISGRMEDENVSKYLSEIGRKGARARAKKLTAEQRSEIAKKAAKASAKVRTAKARKKRKKP